MYIPPILSYTRPDHRKPRAGPRVHVYHTLQVSTFRDQIPALMAGNLQFPFAEGKFPGSTDLEQCGLGFACGAVSPLLSSHEMLNALGNGACLVGGSHEISYAFHQGEGCKLSKKSLGNCI